jgi:hypothetical protein
VDLQQPDQGLDIKNHAVSGMRLWPDLFIFFFAGPGSSSLSRSCSRAYARPLSHQAGIFGKINKNYAFFKD